MAAGNPNGANCESCRFWVRGRRIAGRGLVEDADFPESGECRLKPPSPNSILFARTVAADWCGRWELHAGRKIAQ
jgi:hypothetical protein